MRVLTHDRDFMEWLATRKYPVLMLELELIREDVPCTVLHARGYMEETERLLKSIIPPAPVIIVPPVAVKPPRPPQRLKSGPNYTFTDAQMRIAIAAQTEGQAA